ncbi:hypothetical protein GXW82_03575 [Streptacidiphilus sp. 4-A2]|nr:hypothetical protein [Streptacidiphilus sp. 4-A2]
MDWSELPAEQLDTELARHVAEDRQQPFDMLRPPLARLTVISIAADELLTVFTVHHLLVDNQSLAVLDSELDAAYQALAEGRAPALPDAPQYGAYVRRQDEARRTTAADASGRRQERFADLEDPGPLRLADRGSGAAFERAGVSLPQKEQAASSSSPTAPECPWPRCSTGLALVLSGLTGRDDVVFGFTATDRPRPSPASTRWSACASTPCRCA